MKILILGGTTEASALARLVVPHVAATLSLAGLTRDPVPQPIPVRTGGFGGPDGLAAYLRAERIAALVDATHPFAATMSRNAAEAAARTGTPLLAIRRPPWTASHGDDWRPVADMRAAADAIGPPPRRVLLTIGAKDLAPFSLRPHIYTVRSVEPPPDPPPGATLIAARGPFTEPDEHALLLARRIDVLVTKNAGGSATRAKLDAARRLGLPVVMVERPAAIGGVAAVPDAPAALSWLQATLRGE